MKAVRVSESKTTTPSAMLAVYVSLSWADSSVRHQQVLGDWGTKGYNVGLLRRCLHDVFRVLRFMPVLQICEIAYEGFILEIPRLGQVYKR